MRKLALLLLLSLPLAAQPAITSVTPSSGPVAGGTVVTIKGSGFQTCPTCSPPLPPYVAFNGTPARSVTIADENTLIVTAPPRFPGTTTVHVEQWNGKASLPNAFTFTGKVEDGFDQVLVPLFTARSTAHSARASSPSSASRAWRPRSGPGSSA